MTLRVVGAGLGRTGTNSLKLALERLLGAPCYHMIELFGKTEQVDTWRRAALGEAVDWDQVFDGYAAAVDWPAAGFYDVLMEKYPDAVVLLSTRRDAETWWKSASSTIFQVQDQMAQMAPEHDAMITAVFERTFTPEWRDHDAACAAYDRHNAAVRERVPAARLVDWQPGDGWEPLCTALGVPVPDEPFPHVNSTEDFRKMVGLDRS